MITFTHKGSFNKLEAFLARVSNKNYLNILDKYGQEGVKALAAATPRDTGKTADSWGYEITYTHDTTTISWYNTNVNDGANIAILLQYGHGTGNGGYVQGTDYVNPAMRSIFNSMADQLWKEVSSS